MSRAEEIQREYRLSDIGMGRYNIFGRPLVGLSGIVRFSRRLKVREENVAEHMWYVSYLTLQICNICKVSDKIKNLALEYAICHDIPEIVLDDVNHDVKCNYPQIKRMLEREEDLLLESLGKDIALTHKGNVLHLPPCNYKIAKAIVDLADVHSVAIYLESELLLGNKYFDWIQDTKQRIAEREHILWEAIKNGCETN